MAETIRRTAKRMRTRKTVVMIETFHDSWLPYLKVLWRWGWFLLLSMAVTTVISLLLPEAPAPASYQATLKVQVILPPDQNTAGHMNTATTFYASLFTSPATLSLLLPAYHDTTVNNLQTLITATPVTNSAVVELSATGDTAQDASNLVMAAYNAALQELQNKRLTLTKSLAVALRNELAQSQQAVQNTENQLQSLATAHLTSTYAYLEQESLYREELQRIDAVNQALQTLNQQSFGQDSILKLLNTTPMTTTIEQVTYTQQQRVMLSPVAGLLMGLGGVLLANTFSTSLLSSGKQRE